MLRHAAAWNGGEGLELSQGSALRSFGDPGSGFERGSVQAGASGRTAVAFFTAGS